MEHQQLRDACDPCLQMAKRSEGRPGAAQPCPPGHRAALPKENM